MAESSVISWCAVYGGQFDHWFQPGTKLDRFTGIILCFMRERKLFANFSLKINRYKQWIFAAQFFFFFEKRIFIEFIFFLHVYSFFLECVLGFLLFCKFEPCLWSFWLFCRFPTLPMSYISESYLDFRPPSLETVFDPRDSLFGPGILHNTKRYSKIINPLQKTFYFFQ